MGVRGLAFQAPYQYLAPDPTLIYNTNGPNSKNVSMYYQRVPINNKIVTLFVHFAFSKEIALILRIKVVEQYIAAP